MKPKVDPVALGLLVSSIPVGMVAATLAWIAAGIGGVAIKCLALSSRMIVSANERGKVKVKPRPEMTREEAVRN